MKETLDTFGVGFSTTDVMLYIGVAVVVYILFQDKINPMLKKVTEKIKKVKPPELPIDTGIFDSDPVTQDDIFFDLIKSWKQTRDLAEAYGADKAVEIADNMFPHLVPKEEQHEQE
jgi:hypothetical protein